MKLGVEPKGIVARGIALSSVFEGTHWNATGGGKDKKSRRIFIKYDCLCQSRDHIVVDLSQLEGLSSDYSWLPQSLGISMPDELAREIDRLIE